jgi:hypothetical protein
MSKNKQMWALEELRGELLRSAAERPAMAERWVETAPEAGVQRARRIGEWLPRAIGLAISTAVVVIVAVIALVGHRHPVQHSAARTDCTRQLLGDLAVLRRPQTQADRAFQPGPVPPGVDRAHRASFPYAPVPGLTRLARTLPDGSRVFLAVYAPLPRSLAPPIGDIAFVFVARPRANVADRQVRTLSASFVTETSAPFLSSSYQIPPTEAGDVYLGVVPDKVARVEWTFPRERLPNLPHLHGGHVFRGVTLTANVIGNIAAARAIPYSFFMVSRATWLNATGRTIKTFSYTVGHLAKAGLQSGTAPLISTASSHGSAIRCAQP